MSEPMHLRPYQPADFAQCLAIFDSNTPPYFAPHEQAEFAEFLQKSNDPYFVVTIAADRVIGCGGYYLYTAEPMAGLSWGMVANTYHGTGAGRFLLLARLQQLCQTTNAVAVVINTSQHTYGFFEKVGFVVDTITADGFAVGLDKYKMILHLRPDWCAANGY